MKNFRSALLAAALSLVVAAGSATAAQATTKIRVGASPTPHAEILKVANDVLKPQGYELQIIEYSDYVQPNMALEGKELDANFFQHKPYLDSFSKDRGLKLTSLVAVHIEPMGVYSHKVKNVADVAEGSEVAIPNDPTNGGRALLLLQDLGILTLKEGVGLEATEQDIVENPHNVTIKAMEAANLPASLPDLDFAVINGNYASGAGIGDKVLTTEDAESVAAQTYGNVVAVKEGRENDPAVQALVAVLMSGDVQAWIEESYNGVVMPMGAQELDIPEIAEPVTLKVGASPSPHAEILEHVKPLLAEHNVELDIVEFDDYVMPNTGVEDGSLDANYFQHQPYLNDFNAEQSTHIVSVATVHYEPMGIYPGKTASLDVFGK